MNESMEEAILYAKKYLEDVLSFFGLTPTSTLRPRMMKLSSWIFRQPI